MHSISKRIVQLFLNRRVIKEVSSRNSIIMDGNVATTKSQFQPNISLETPLEDYRKLMKDKMESDEIIPDEVIRENYSAISEKMRQIIWTLLFSEQSTTEKDKLQKAGNCLAAYKSDACFYRPWAYNEWIPKVRDELLKRNMLDFWREQVVSRELGPCWARDSDYFDDIEDKPLEFYRHAGCEAPFSDEETENDDVEMIKASPAEPIELPALPVGNVALSSPFLATATTVAVTTAPTNISHAKPYQDYHAMVEHQLDLDADNSTELNKIFAEVRHVIWDLLFAKPELSEENYEKVAAVLAAYKADACFFNPWDYNEWIVKVRDELFVRKHFDFWQHVIVAEKLGLCWYKDSDFFDDSEDQRPIDFYTSGDKLIEEKLLNE